jgi:hypothetical protein
VAAAQQTPYHWSAAYVLTAVALLALGRWGKSPDLLRSNAQNSG